MAESVKPPKYFVTSTLENIAVSWKLWLQQFDWYAIATGLDKKSPEVQVAIFMSSIGPDAAVIYNTFKLNETESQSLKTIKTKFTNHFIPKINETYERYVFNQIVQNDGQSIDDFLTNLKSKVKNCGYGQLEDSIIRDRVVIGVQSDIAREKLLSEENLTLDKTINICHSTEQVRSHLESMKNSNAVNAITCNKKKNINNTKKEDEEFHCKRCDTTHRRKSCPAFGKECKNCKKKNHFAKCCRCKKVETVTKECEKEESSEEDVDTLRVSTCEADIDTEDWYEKAYLQNNIMVKFKLDSGSQCNVISKRILEKCKAEIRPTITKHLTSFSGHKMTVLGEAIIRTKIKEITTEVKYLIVDCDVTPILGKATGVKLNLIKRIDIINVDEDLYDGIGCLKQYVYDIDLVDDPKLPICPARKVPHILRKEVKEELDNMVKEKIIVPVTEPTPAVSPMVVVRKNNKIRLCIDPSEINKNLKRRHYPLNTIEEISARLHDSSWFTLLDCKKGFWQLKVTPRTSKYLTFSTPFGRYSCLRMPFGLASAPEVFQQVMSSLLAEIENVEVSMDDILIHAATKEDLERKTEKVLKKFKDSGLKLNKEKCFYNKQEIKFLGHILTKNGLMPDPEKLETIDKIKKPENVKELQRFLGLITYLSKFIKNLSDITAPLRVLLQKDIEWSWETEQEEAFQELKKSLKSPPVLGYYDPKAPIILSVDASSYACGGVLIQNDKPIAYCAKSFTKTEQNYSQLEKETNAILVACKKFHNYIWGCKDITIESDHKPLQTIFKKPLPDAPPRLQRMFLQILPYNAKIVYKKGTEMYVADTLSRDCVNISQEEMDDKTITICALLPFSKERKIELRQELENDEEMIELKKTILDDSPALKPTVEPAPGLHTSEPGNQCPVVQPTASQVVEHPSTQAPPTNIAPDQPAIQRYAVDTTPAPCTTRSGRVVVQPARYR
ncbi:uncharacterized protein LOC126369844 [Pectinophora gossypiella]|uniref:uncharacterized protein LOC126369844 n=1 Tax=Pectinophora gossypiella TaxID=13191 RepID=UPI00214EADEC|nr:uncharacterized protein LOC126369844 [Pectinophora gossypiella]